jgi:predicted HTH domain antitoxin
MEFHPIADLFPLMEGDEFEALCTDIAANGLLEAIWTAEGKIIDGRNRFRACQRTGTEPRFREWSGGEGSLVSFVVSLNLNRRHLNESQRAMLAAKLANVDGAGRPKEIPQICGIISQADAAKMLNVSERTISSARKIQKDGVPELTKKIESGRISVAAAARIAELPKRRQKSLIKRGRKAHRKLLADLKRKSLATVIRKGSGCLYCDPRAEFTAAAVSAFCQTLAQRSPEFGSYFEDVVEEIEGLQISAATRSNYERILAAIDLGVQEQNELRIATSLGHAEFDAAIACMLDYGMIRATRQGGKTDVARGAAKTIYRRAEKGPDAAAELEYEMVAEDF